MAGYLSVHLFLYGGTTAFNSYYDRDEGPVGGMLEPPGVSPGLLPFSLAVQALGLPLALLVGRGFTLAWLLLFLVFTAASTRGCGSRPGPPPRWPPSRWARARWASRWAGWRWRRGVRWHRPAAPSACSARPWS